MRTLLDALAAGAAEGLIHGWLTVAVLFHLTCAGAAAHADVLQRAAEAGCLMPFKVVQRDKDIRVHDRLTDLSLFDMFGAIEGTNFSSRPLSPSAMIIWQPVEATENPFSAAASRCSSAFLRLPG